MPGVYRYSIDQLGMIINKIIKHNIPMVALFPSTPNYKKDKFGIRIENLVYVNKKNGKLGRCLKRSYYH